MNLLVKFLLGRGFGKLQELIAKAIRHGMTTVGGYLVSQGLITDADATVLQGAAVIAVGVLLSFVRTFLARYAA